MKITNQWDSKEGRYRCLRRLAVRAKEVFAGELHLDFLKERAVTSAFLANFDRPAKSVCVCVSGTFSRHCK